MKKLFVFLKIALFIFVFGVLAAGVMFFVIFKNLPSLEQIGTRQVAQSTKIYDRTGTVLLYEIHGEEKRTVIPFSEIPDTLKQATIAIEDANFYNHSAFSWKGLTRAFISNIFKGGYSQGGSTITQQLAKNAFLTREKTITRKIKELILAFQFEKKYSKDEILNLYLNQIPYGSNAYGVEAAAQVFFKKSAKDVTLAQAALLAALPQSPSYYWPYGTHVPELLARKNKVLDQMLAQNYITQEQCDKAKNEKLEFAPHTTGLKAPHFSLMVQEYLNDKYGEGFAETAGLNVITTLDYELQQSAETAVADGAANNTKNYKGFNAALVAQDATNGQVLAMVGSKNYFDPPEPANCTPGKDCRFEGNFNVAAQGLRQPGSTMKPIAYVTAFQKGYSPDTVIFDLPTEFASKNDACPLIVDFDNEDDSCFHPHNFDGTFQGPVNLRNALAQSINIPAVKMFYLAGMDDTLQNAKNFGITTLKERSRYGLSLVLGGGEVTLLDITGAYSVFAQEGVKHQQTYILKITDAQGNVLEEYKDNSTQVIDAQYPRMINDILTDTKARSPLFSSSLSLTIFPGREVAMKTGTTNDYRDAWTIGYTPDLVVGVWAGNNNNAPMEKQGGSILAAVPIWSAFMKDAIKDRPLLTFNAPEPVFSEKPMLHGEYIVNYKIGNQLLPQIHDLLFYVDKNNPLGAQPTNPEKDSQFENWEIPVLNWAKQTIPDFETKYNQPLPSEAITQNTTSDYAPKITINYPKNGDFIREGSNINIQTTIESSLDLQKIEIYFNNNLIVAQNIPTNTKTYNFNYNFNPQNIDTQNEFKLKAYDIFNNTKESSVILYK